MDVSELTDEEEEEEEKSEVEPAKTWNFEQNGATTKESDRAEDVVPVKTKYVPPISRVGGGRRGGNQPKLDLTNEEMFPSIAKADEIEKEMSKLEEKNTKLVLHLPNFANSLFSEFLLKAVGQLREKVTTPSKASQLQEFIALPIVNKAPIVLQLLRDVRLLTTQHHPLTSMLSQVRDPTAVGDLPLIAWIQLSSDIEITTFSTRFLYYRCFALLVTFLPGLHLYGCSDS